GRPSGDRRLAGAVRDLRAGPGRGHPVPGLPGGTPATVPPAVPAAVGAGQPAVTAPPIPPTLAWGESGPREDAPATLPRSTAPRRSIRAQQRVQVRRARRLPGRPEPTDPRRARASPDTFRRHRRCRIWPVTARSSFSISATARTGSTLIRSVSWTG